MKSGYINMKLSGGVYVKFYMRLVVDLRLVVV